MRNKKRVAQKIAETRKSQLCMASASLYLMVTLLNAAQFMIIVTFYCKSHHQEYLILEFTLIVLTF